MTGLINFVTIAGAFGQPKLVINAMDVMRNAAVDQGGVDGAAYHDSLLMKVVTMGVTQGCLPIILVSSDRCTNTQLWLQSIEFCWEFSHVWVLLPKTSVDGCSSNLLEQKAVMRVNFWDRCKYVYARIYLEQVVSLSIQV